jgi:hydrogenase expression/formation protein HypC
MCIGIPMQVVESREGFALCLVHGEPRRIDTLLVGEQPAGTWLLTFLDTAREVLTPAAARRALDALQAVDMAMQGRAGFDHLFRDLIEREPELPEFLGVPSPDFAPGD